MFHAMYSQLTKWLVSQDIYYSSVGKYGCEHSLSCSSAHIKKVVEKAIQIGFPKSSLRVNGDEIVITP